jgi:hypothetical protein
MSVGSRRLLSLGLAILAGLPLVSARDAVAEPIADTKARMEIESQRVERRFTADRLAAYKLVRSATPDYLLAAEKMYALRSLLEADTSLPRARRIDLLNTIKFDLDNLKKVAVEHRKAAAPRDSDLAREAFRDARATVRRDYNSSERDRRERVRETDSIIGSRGKALADSRDRRAKTNAGYLGAMASVDKSNILPRGNIEFPTNWRELSMRRMKPSMMTAKERAIMKALSTVISVDYSSNSLSEVIDSLEKLTGQSLVVDKQALDEAAVNYETVITCKLKATTRTVLKKILGDLNLAYVVKDQAIFVTSKARAKQMTTTRTYYVGDLAPLVDQRLGPIGSQLAMLAVVENLTNLITRTVEPQSWQVNNPDAVGTIGFDPVRQALIVTQSAEMHFALGGLR